MAEPQPGIVSKRRLTMWSGTWNFTVSQKTISPKKYNTNPVHSEVLEAVGIVPAGKALDLGCGQGRNALFLAQHGFE